jgi:hypothetical protein
MNKTPTPKRETELKTLVVILKGLMNRAFLPGTVLVDAKFGIKFEVDDERNFTIIGDHETYHIELP